MFNKIKKPIVIIIIAGLVLTNFYFLTVQPVKAADGGAGWGNFWRETIVDHVLKPLVRTIARKLVDTYITKMVDQINKNGRSRNSPGFVDIWREFITEAQYRGEDVFRSILSNTSLCPHTTSNLRSTFQVGTTTRPLGAGIRVNNLQPYTLRARCTMPQGWLIKNFQADFSSNGGWNALVRLSEPQNNFYGSLLMAGTELAAQRALDAAGDQVEITSGGGFMNARASTLNPSTQQSCNQGFCTNGNPLQGYGCNSNGTCVAMTGGNVTTDKPDCNNSCPNGIEARKCTDSAACWNPESQARLSFLGQTLTPAKVIGESATKFIDTKLSWVISSQDVVMILANATFALLDNLTNFRKQPRADSQVRDQKTEDYQACIKACGGKRGDSYKVCLEKCAKDLGQDVPGFGPPPPSYSQASYGTYSQASYGTYSQASYGNPPPPPGGGNNTLGSGSSLSPGGALTSLDGQCSFDLDMGGNLILYDTSVSPANVLWTSGTSGGVELAMQGDGNLVLYNASGTDIWSRITNSAGAILDLSNAPCQAVIYTGIGGSAITQIAP